MKKKQKSFTKELRRFILGKFKILTYLIRGNDVVTDRRREMLALAMGFVWQNKMKGDYLEFGVYQGATFCKAYYLAQRCIRDSMKFYAFDSFKGLPKNQGLDDDKESVFSEGEYSCSKDSFIKNLSARGIKQDKVQITEGWFKDSLNEQRKKELPISKASILWVDCDLYESTVPVLDFITGYVQNGTILIFDDWFCFRGDPDKGQQRAFREWLSKNTSITASEFHKYSWHGNSFILHKDNS
ncbi:TylF/MycF/NovP-related O-methyltransferase [Thermoproteota archaeon]